MTRSLVLCCTRIALLVPSFIILASAQETGFHNLSASAPVQIIAVKRGTIGVNLRAVPVAFDVDSRHAPNSVSIPITTSWNVSPLEISGVELIAYFDDPYRALVDDHGNAIASAELSGKVGRAMPAAFDQTNFFGPAGGSLRLFGESITHANARATRNDVLELRLNAVARERSPGLYSGVLNLESRYF